MEINKQLFEDVLSGKLKGTFILKNGHTIKSNRLFSSTRILIYALRGFLNFSAENDIINFIPDTNMKENELTIEIPNNKVVDWDESKKQNKIVLKDKQLTYDDICKELFSKEYYYICGSGEIVGSFCSPRFLSDVNNAVSKHQLECILAKNKLANVAKYLNDGWKRDGYNGEFGYFICKLPKEIEIIQCDNYKFNNNVIFKSKELAQQAIDILGEETVKLALEPLGI